MKRLLTTFLLILSYSSYLSAQDFRISRLNMLQGLSSDFVTDMATDKRGFLWVSTEEGLNRFDGQGFRNYYKDQGSRQTITGNELNCLLDDPKEPILWIGTQRNGLCAYFYDENRFESFLHDTKNSLSIATNDITCLTPAADGRIWVGTYWQGVDRLDQQTGQFEHLNTMTVRGLPSNQTWCVLDDGHGLLYIGHVNDGLSMVDLKHKTAHNIRHNHSDGAPMGIHCLWLDNNRRLWIGTTHGLAYLDSQSDTIVHLTDGGRLDGRIFSIRQLSDGHLWMATERHGAVWTDLSHWQPGSAEPVFHYIGPGNGRLDLSEGSLRCLLEDSFHNLWIGTYGRGLNFLTRQLPTFSQLTHDDSAPLQSLDNETVLAIAVDRQRLKWIGTDGDGVNCFDSRGRKTASLLPGRSVQALHTDRRGRVWMGCFDDNVYIARSSATPLTPVFRNERHDVRSFYEQGDTMWICTSEGLYTADMNTLKTTHHYSIANNLTRCMAIDTKGRRWIGTFGNGLQVYSPQMRRLRVFDRSNGLPSNTVNHLAIDGQGRLWVATAEGVVRFDSPDSPQYRVYGWKSGLENIHIKAILTDSAGNIWASTNKGISCLRKGEEMFLNYGNRDNVPAANFCIGSAASEPDRLYFGATAGLCFFRPDDVLRPRQTPKPLIAGLQVLTARTDSLVTILPNQQVELRYFENTLTVLTGLDNYALAPQTDYAYRMKGLSDHWTTATNGSITFRELPPGNYRLQVRCRLHNQPWADDVAEVTIRINPPWWRTWWAYLLYLMAGAALIGFVRISYRNRIHLRNLKEQWAQLQESLEAQHEEQKQHQLRASLNELDQQFLTKINQLINEHMDGEVDIAYLAEGVHVSQSTLYRKMKSLTGITTNEYVRRYKLHYAEQLLLEGRYNVTEVAYRVGMSTPGYFRKCFKEEFGATPTEYIRKLSNAQK